MFYLFLYHKHTGEKTIEIRQNSFLLSSQISDSGNPLELQFGKIQVFL